MNGGIMLPNDNSIMHFPFSILYLVSGFSLSVLATTSEVVETLEHISGPSEAVVALWTCGPGLAAGLSLQLLGDPQTPRKMCGELLASLVMSFAGGAAMMIFAEEYASVWSLVLAGIGAGATGSQGLRIYQKRTNKLIDKGRPDIK